MSSSVGYYVSAADVEARRQRELRAAIAALRSRLDRTRNRASAAGIDMTRRSGTAATASDGRTSDQLAADESTLRDEVARAEEEFDRGLTTRLGERIGRFSRVDAAAPDAVAELARERTGERFAAETDETRQRQRRRAVVADAEHLLSQSATRCDPADLPELTRRVRDLSAMDSMVLRAEALDVAISVNESVQRRTSVDRAEEQRARLLSMLTDALPEERRSLLDAVRVADDPAEWEQAVHQAIYRADMIAERKRVAAVAMSALAEAGCDLGADFATLLIEREQAVVPLCDTSDYGVLVRLPAAGGRLMAAVVRDGDNAAEAASAAAQRDRDVAAQQSFCDDVLPDFTTALRAGGVDVRTEPYVLLEPGRMPVAPAPTDGWSRPVGRRAARPRWTAQFQQRTMERGHGH